MSDNNPNAHTNTSHTEQDGDLTLKDVLYTLMEFWRELWRRKWWIVLASLIFASFLGYKAYNTTPMFDAKLTYVFNDNSGGGALSGLLGSFGLGGEDKANLNRVLELSKSRNIIQKILFTKVELDTLGKKEDYIANYLIALHRYDKLWTNENTDYTDFRFNSGNINDFSRKELNALKMLYGLIVGTPSVKEPLFTNSFDKSTGILTISTKTVDEDLSILMSTQVFNELRTYYLDNITKGSQNTLTFTKEKTDSVYTLLRIKETQLSKFDDSHRNLADPGLLTQRKMLETEILKLKAMYAEVTKNRELADFRLNSGLPEIVIIDEPIPPVGMSAPSLIIEIIKGILFGGLLAFTIISGRKIVLDALKS